MAAIRARFQSLGLSASAVQSGFMAVAMIVAGGFDYLVNIVAGRQLPPSEFFVFVAVTALLQVMVQATNVIRNVVAYYAAEATVYPDATNRVGSVLGRSWRWAWRWGLLATGIMALISPLLARLLRVDTPWPLWAASLALLLLFLRPVTDGALQGIQHFFGLGSVQILQSFLRLVFAGMLIWLGGRAAGAVLALPLGSTVALLLAVWLLRGYFRAAPPDAPPRPISWRYSIYTLIGLSAFALMANVDAIVVRRFFGDAAAAAYAPVVTLGKMNLFIPLGIGLVLFPKATQRQAAGRDPRPVLLLALAATLLPGLLLTLLYWLFPAEIVRLVFGEAYADPGILLALVGLATTLYAGVNIWLNYALSLERRAMVWLLAAIVLSQITAMLLFHTRLETIALIMIAAGLLGNIAGAATTLGATSASATGAAGPKI
jgi:O-antigen/teichoic acid export membrane protein